MAELTPKERLQPSLLDRLTDEEPDRKQESRERRIISPQRLRESVRRDLTWLFNTTNMTALHPVDGYEHAERSTLNFGIPDFTGRTAGSINPQLLERELRTAIWDFEPRLNKDSVRVKLIVDRERMNHNAMCFSIEAELWAQPIPLRLFLRTDLDLETGEAVVEDSGGDSE
ncbi:MAG TPA: type VI secretion system baseplate subunit TssE [Polyangiaceae bacterium]|nr:type VI secretion system baseplate subunit TssE [Polyangiaceae bacterium]